MSGHTVVIADNGKLKCDCGEQFDDLDSMHEHNLVSFNNPEPKHIEARRMGSWERFVMVERCAETVRAVECERVACWNKGNGRECFSIIGTDQAGEPVQWHELSEVEALLLRHHGGWIMYSHHAFKLC
jgi:hypothetical protein